MAATSTCWNCLGEFDALGAVWCSDDPKNPTKLCPFCLRCFCDASAEYKQEFWRQAPPQLVDELQTLGKSQDRLGDVLIRMKKITTPQLLDALVEQRRHGQRLGEILIDRGFVSRRGHRRGAALAGRQPPDGHRGGAERDPVSGSRAPPTASSTTCWSSAPASAPRT